MRLAALAMVFAVVVLSALGWHDAAVHDRLDEIRGAEASEADVCNFSHATYARVAAQTAVLDSILTVFVTMEADRQGIPPRPVVREAERTLEALRAASSKIHACKARSSSRRL